ncbi:MAG: metallophosphoesterase, partial [Sphingobacteriales bacterium]
MSTINTDNKHNIPKRSNEDYLSSSRSELVNHLKTEITKKPTHSIGDFLTKTFWSWIYHYFKSRFGRKFPYPCYHNNETGIYRMEDNAEVVIGIASDWATDTQEALDVAKRMAAHTPDYTIHVGDTYYVGAPPEIESNFVIPDAPWIRGKRGSFAVLGNHEMYARGDAFFENLLPTLGIKDVQGKFAGQKAGYFCLENEHWRILGLDTGYHSTG